MDQNKFITRPRNKYIMEMCRICSYWMIIIIARLNGSSKHCPSANTECKCCVTNFIWKSPPQTCYEVGYNVCLEQIPSGCPSRLLITSAVWVRFWHAGRWISRDFLLPPSVSHCRPPTKFSNINATLYPRDFSSTIEVWPVHRNLPGCFTPPAFSAEPSELSGLFDWSIVEHIRPFYMFPGKALTALLWGIPAMVQEPEGSYRRSSHPEAPPPPAQNPSSGLTDLMGQCRGSFGGRKLG